MKDVIIYTTDYCPYCHAAKVLLTSKGVAFKEINVQNDPEQRKWLIQATGLTTVPQIFIAGQPYGGFDDINALNKSGKLDGILGI